ncbi:MAG: CocE/NonD family hydrolase, partial [Candidatus Aminicenantes bacterium]|nr:CocE/NonD family hydrolase [Candidatus Aminicenantes bacterium]
MKKRITSVTPFILVLILSVTVSRAESVISRPDYQLRLDLGVMIPMRDGVKLSSDFYFPDAEGGFPTILIRTPYNNSIPRYDRYGKFYASRGYVVVIQDCRGRYDSEGEWYPYLELLILERML